MENGKSFPSAPLLLCSFASVPVLLCCSSANHPCAILLPVLWSGLDGYWRWCFQISGFKSQDLKFTGSETAGARGKSEHRRATDWLTARRGEPTTSATENKPADGSSAISDRGQVMGE